MKHLDDVGMSYWQHMWVAMGCSLRFLRASLAVALHALVPSVFVTAGSSTAHEIVCEFMSYRPYKNRILVRFNTKWKEDELLRKWRVLENGVETLAHEVSITIPCKTIQEDVTEGTRWHFLCWGEAVWDGTNATIK